MIGGEDVQSRVGVPRRPLTRTIAVQRSQEIS